MTVKLGLVALALVVIALTVAYLMRPLALVSPVVAGPAVNAVPGSVTVQAEYQMDMKSEVGGRIVKSDLEPGRKVQAGDFLVQIDPGDLELDVQRIQSEYEALKQRIAIGSQIALELATARDELVNKERLYKIGNVSESEYTKQVRLVKQYEQRLALEEVENKQKADAYENTLKVKRRQLQKMTIISPFEGVIASAYVRPGDLISGEVTIARLISTSRTVEAKISEENFSGLKVGQKASVRFLGYGPQLYGASVTKVLPTADPETQRYIVHLNVDLTSDKLVPGLTGEVSIIIGERDSKTNVPRRALRGNQIYVVRDGRVQVRAVQVGYVGLNQVEVLTGLQPDEMVIVEELERFRDGDRVRTQLAK